MKTIHTWKSAIVPVVAAVTLMASAPAWAADGSTPTHPRGPSGASTGTAKVGLTAPTGYTPPDHSSVVLRSHLGIAGLPACPTNNQTATVITAPDVTSISPTIGPVTGSTNLTISGYNFTGCETDGQPTTSGTPPVTTVSVTTYLNQIYGVEFDSTSTPQVKLGAQTFSIVSNSVMTALTPPGPLCSPTTAMKLTVDAVAITQAFTYTLNATPPPTYTLSGEQPPGTSTTKSGQQNPPVLFTYLNEGPQVIACAKDGTPYDLAGGNAVVVQMARELAADVNLDRAGLGLPGLSVNPALVNVANAWADTQANGTAGAAASAKASVTSSDACILQEVAASGYSSGSSVLWAAENGGAFEGPSKTGDLNTAFVASTSPENTTSVTVGTGSGGSGCQLGGGVGGSSSVANYSTAHNIFSSTFTAMGIAVACTGVNQGSCFAAEVFAGPNPVQPDCADQKPTNCGSPPPATLGGTQALNVLPAAPTAVTAALQAVPGGGFVLNGTWTAPPAEGYDPVNMYVFVDTDVLTGQPCLWATGGLVYAAAIGGCYIGSSTNLVPITTDPYTVSVQAVNDLCKFAGGGCFPEALYPPPADPLTSVSPCLAYGEADYPSCTVTTGTPPSPSGPFEAATPYPVRWNPPCNNGVACTKNDQGLSYRFVATDGGVFTFGHDAFYGSQAGQPIGGSMVGIAGTSDAGGYWTCSSNGSVYSFGDAGFFGSTGNIRIVAPVIAMAASPDSRGYWLAASDGGIFAFGDATYFGSAAGQLKNAKVVGIAVTPDGGGYWLAASDGSVFRFGDAGPLGSLAGGPAHAPVVGIAATQDGRGYWIATADGGVFSYGDASFLGSAVGSSGSNAIIGISSTLDGLGYWLLTQSGGLITYGDATFSGSVATKALAAPVVSMEVN